MKPYKKCHSCDSCTDCNHNFGLQCIKYKLYAITSHHIFPSGLIQTHPTNWLISKTNMDWHLWRVSKCCTDCFCSTCAQIGNFIYVLWVDNTTNLSSIRCYLTPSGLFWFTSYSEQFWYFLFLLLTCLLFLLFGEYKKISENLVSMFFCIWIVYKCYV